MCGIQPFTEEFDLVIDNFYTDAEELFQDNVDGDELESWSTTYATREVAMCDGGGYSKIMTLHLDTGSLVLEDLLDDDSCSGGYTVKSHNGIQIQIDYLHNMVLALANGSTSTTTTDPLPAPFTIYLALPLIILMRRIR